MSWQENIRLLWTDHLIWVRHFLISLMFRLRDLSYVLIRTMQNTIDFSAQLTPFYGLDSAKRYESLLAEKVLLLSELASTIKIDADISVQLLKLQVTADDIGSLFAELNPFGNKAVWQQLLYTQLQLEERLIREIGKDKFSASISTYDATYQNALKMATYMINGITAQFPQYAYPTGTIVMT